jgi:hypothetical protein
MVALKAGIAFVWLCLGYWLLWPFEYVGGSTGAGSYERWVLPKDGGHPYLEWTANSVLVHLDDGGTVRLTAADREFGKDIQAVYAEPLQGVRFRKARIGYWYGFEKIGPEPVYDPNAWRKRLPDDIAPPGTCGSTSPLRRVR